ncbi:MFS transporter [uncultured Ruthenibacterium sp.]|uniref:MFS transporter n=1 Tax=uncultured Ruthenibacterium sp. TaxID=1905347 RepID=UPI00349E6AFF
MSKAWIKDVRNCAYAVLLTTAMALGTSGLSWFVVPVTEQEGYSRAAFALCSSLVSLPSLFLFPVLGLILKKIGPRKLVAIGLVGGTLFFGGLSLSHSLPAFYVNSVLLGCVLMPSTSFVTTVLVNTAFSNHRQMMMGIVASGSGVGSVLCGLSIPEIISIWGWPGGYRWLAVLWLVLLGIALILMPKKYDVQEEPKQKLKAPQFWKTGTFWFLGAAAFCLSAVNGVYQHIQAFLMDAGFSSTLSGQVVGIFGVVLIFFKLTFGALWERMGMRLGLCVSQGLYVIAFVLLLSGNDPWRMVAAVVLLAAGSATVSMAPSLVAREVYTAELFVALWGTLSLFGTLGNSVGVWAWGLVYDCFGNYRFGFIAAGLFIVLSWVCYQILLKGGQKKTQTSKHV